MTSNQEDKLLVLVTETHDAVIEIKARCEPCQIMVASHRRVLHGNGQDGLVSRMAVVEATTGEMTKQAEKQAGWMRVQLGAVIVALLGFIGMAAKFFFKGT